MQLSAISALATTPLQPELRTMFTWVQGNRRSREDHPLSVGPPGASYASFDDAVAAARVLVRDGQRIEPGWGALAPMHAVIAVAGGFSPVTLQLPGGGDMPIDGEIADGSTGVKLLGLTIDRAATTNVVALVGLNSLIDLRSAPELSEWWRAVDPGRTPGPWSRI